MAGEVAKKLDPVVAKYYQLLTGEVAAGTVTLGQLWGVLMVVVAMVGKDLIERRGMHPLEMDMLTETTAMLQRVNQKQAAPELAETGK